MTYAMTLDNSWELMTEDEMYDVNGGFLGWFKEARESVIGQAIEIVYTGIRVVLGAKAVATLMVFAAIDKAFGAYTTALQFIWHNWQLVLAATIAFIGVALSIWYMANN